jgi:ribonuclease G
MDKELIIRSNADAVDFALLKDGKLIELQTEKDGGADFSVGDIFLAKVKKSLAGLNAAFVDVGYEKDGFLHYHDLGPQIKSIINYVKLVKSKKINNFSYLKEEKFDKDINKDGKITDVLHPNQSVLVQVVKEPISTKGPRLSSEISLAGRYIVLVPFADRISVSQRIESKEEKSRLKRLVKSIKPKGFSIIIRTVAEGKKVAEIDQDLHNLMQRWENMCKKIPKAKHPSKVLGEVNKASSILRDIFNDSFTAIKVDDEQLSEDLKDYVGEISPNKESIVQYYQNKVPIFEKFGIERQIKTSFGRSVTMKKGAYLIIEHTEAMHVIDVNSGNRSNKAKTQQDTALEVNLISAEEIARQLRLRDMGGIIVIDFIDMQKAESRKKLIDVLEKEMSDDRAKHKILPPSKFGLVQITRQRVRPEMAIKTTEENPNENGQVEAPIVVLNKIKTDLLKIIKSGKHHSIKLTAHPFVAAYITKGIPSIRTKWWIDHKQWVKIEPRDAYRYLEYHFLDKRGDIIKI